MSNQKTPQAVTIVFEKKFWIEKLMFNIAKINDLDYLAGLCSLVENHFPGIDETVPSYSIQSKQTIQKIGAFDRY